MKLYQYTIFKQDGSVETLEPCPKKQFFGEGGLYGLLNCSTIELIPSAYYKGKKLGRVNMYGDEEARFNAKNHRNPHFNVLKDHLGEEWDVVGDIVMEKKV